LFQYAILNACERIELTLISPLSGGERRRLSIALELVNFPSILFAQQPTNGLDSANALMLVQVRRKRKLMYLSKQSDTSVIGFKPTASAHLFLFSISSKLFSCIIFLCSVCPIYTFPLCTVVFPPNSALQGVGNRRPPRDDHVARAAVAAAAVAVRQGAAHVEGFRYAGAGIAE
jgi:hypothetical protein